MGTIACKDCGKPVGASAASCIHCGARLKGPDGIKVAAYIIVAVLTLAVAWQCGTEIHRTNPVDQPAHKAR